MAAPSSLTLLSTRGKDEFELTERNHMLIFAHKHRNAHRTMSPVCINRFVELFYCGLFLFFLFLTHFLRLSKLRQVVWLFFSLNKTMLIFNIPEHNCQLYLSSYIIVSPSILFNLVLLFYPPGRIKWSVCYLISINQ